MCICSFPISTYLILNITLWKYFKFIYNMKYLRTLKNSQPQISINISKAIHDHFTYNLEKKKYQRSMIFLKITPGHISEENCNLNRYLHPSVHCCIIYNSQDMEATQTSISRWMKMWYVCMCVCVCVCVHMCVCVCTCINVFIYTYVYIYVFIYICLYMCVCIYMYIHTQWNITWP